MTLIFCIHSMRLIHVRKYVIRKNYKTVEIKEKNEYVLLHRVILKSSKWKFIKEVIMKHTTIFAKFGLYLIYLLHKLQFVHILVFSLNGPC